MVGGPGKGVGKIGRVVISNRGLRNSFVPTVLTNDACGIRMVV